MLNSRLEAAIRDLAARHRSLHSTLLRSACSGRLLHAVRRHADLEIRQLDLRGQNGEEQRAALGRAAAADRQRGFALGEPFVRFAMAQLRDDTVELVMSAHHAVVDGWSGIELENQLFAAYRLAKVGELKLPAPSPINSHKEFVALEVEMARSETAAQFWRKELSDGAHTPLARLRRGREMFATVVERLDAAAAATIKQCATDTRVSLKAVCLSLVTEALHRHFGTQRLTIGVVSNGRSERLTDPFTATGLFWNIVPFGSRHTIQSGARAARQAQDHLDRIEPYARYPLSAMGSLSDRDTLFDTVFNFINFHNEKASFDEVELLEFRGADRFHYPLTVVMSVPPEAAAPAIDIRVECHQDYVSTREVHMLLKTVRTRIDQLAEPYALGECGS